MHLQAELAMKIWLDVNKVLKKQNMLAKAHGFDKTDTVNLCKFHIFFEKLARQITGFPARRVPNHHSCC